ncbi:FixH family protein [Rheinheimera salexigens]|uniref:Nitrogen fixation protein FixH n=2 Tax=Rheinheimera salexigens TaxID=1628148 RepID=A0A1E7QAG2_9GAMM|nr:nitrogen fixation protein FixH [Rheinheimera salexigens]
MQQDIKPWYKQLWPWLLIAVPVFTALKAAHTVMLMQGNIPDMVVDDYYKEGQAINQRLALYREAELRNLDAKVLIAGNQIIIRFAQNDTLGEHMLLDFYHPTIANKDFNLTAERSGKLLYIATLPHSLQGNWRIAVTDNSKAWKLRANLVLPASQEIQLGY